MMECLEVTATLPRARFMRRRDYTSEAIGVAMEHLQYMVALQMDLQDELIADSYADYSRKSCQHIEYITENDA